MSHLSIISDLENAIGEQVDYATPEETAGFHHFGLHREDGSVVVLSWDGGTEYTVLVYDNMSHYQNDNPSSYYTALDDEDAIWQTVEIFNRTADRLDEEV